MTPIHVLRNPCGRQLIRLLAVISMLIPGFARAELVDNGDGTVTDTASGLMWLKNANAAGVDKTWADAQAWVDTTLNGPGFAGYHDWRLPSGESPDGTVCDSRQTHSECLGTEFATLYFTDTVRVGHPGPFQNVFGNYWTSTVFPADATRAMAQDFVDGGQNDFPKANTNWVWPVRTATLNPSPQLQVTELVVPAQDPGRFNILVDGAAISYNFGSGQSSGYVPLAAGTHQVGESAASGTALTAYQVIYGGDCDAQGHVSLAAGDRKLCTITTIRLPRLTVRKILRPAIADGRFNLLVDGRIRVRNAADGGTTGKLQLAPGSHWVFETPSGPPQIHSFIETLRHYAVRFGGACTAEGLVTLQPGDDKICTITNTRRTDPITASECARACQWYEAVCVAEIRISGTLSKSVCESVTARCTGACPSSK